MFLMSSIDLVFTVVVGGCLLLLIIILIAKKITDKKVRKTIAREMDRLKNTDSALALANSKSKQVEVTPTLEETDDVEEELVEETTEVVEETPVVEETTEVVEETPVVEETVVEETPVVEETQEVEETAVVEETPVEEETVEVVEEAPKATRTYNGKYEVYKENSYYRYRLKASNGEILFESEIYATLKTAKASIEAVKRNLVNGKTSIIKDKKNNFKFKLTAANHRTLAISANYSTEKAAQSALESFKRFAQTEDVVEIELPAEELDAQLVELTKTHDEDKKGGKFILKKDTNGEFSWELKPNNGEVLCRASGYSSKNTVDTSVQSFRENVKTGKFYAYCDKNNKFQFKLYSSTGRLCLVGESYDTQEAVQSAVRSILNFIELATIQDKTANTGTKKTKTVTKTVKTTTTTITN